MACAGFNGHEGALGLGQSLGILISGRKVCLQHLFCFLLHIQVQCGVHLESFFVNSIRIVLVADGLDHVADEIGSGAVCAFGSLGLSQVKVCFLGSLGIGFGNIAILGHLVQYDALAVLGRFQTPEGRVVVRAVGKSGQHSALRQCQVFHVFAEIDAGSSLDAVAALAEVNLVHVHFQNLFLGVLIFNLQCQYHFQQFSFQCLLLGKEGISGQLLGNGGAALSCGVAAEHVVPDGAEDAPGIDAVVFIESHVFRCHKGILQVLGNLGNRHRNAVFLGMHRGNEPSFIIVNAG